MERTKQAKESTGPELPEGQEAAPEAAVATTEELDALIVALARERKASEGCITRLKYLQADFDNYRKRMEREMEETKRRTAESIYANLLEVLDELELAIDNGRSTNSHDALLEGVEMTLKKLKKMLAAEGISEVACHGGVFDPKYHSAVQAVERDDLEEGTVVEETRKGYLINGRVLRPSMVKVSVKGSGPKKECLDKKGEK